MFPFDFHPFVFVFVGFVLMAVVCFSLLVSLINTRFKRYTAVLPVHDSFVDFFDNGRVVRLLRRDYGSGSSPVSSETTVRLGFSRTLIRYAKRETIMHVKTKRSVIGHICLNSYPPIECHVDAGEQACQICKDYKTADMTCIHFSKSFRYHLDGIQRIIPANQEPHLGWCLPREFEKRLNRNCNPNTAQWLLSYDDSHRPHFVCKCRYPNLMTNIGTIDDDCTRPVGCQPGQLDDDSRAGRVDPYVSGYCKCPKSYYPDYDATIGPVCKVNSILEEPRDKRGFAGLLEDHGLAHNFPVLPITHISTEFLSLLNTGRPDAFADPRLPNPCLIDILTGTPFEEGTGCYLARRWLAPGNLTEEEKLLFFSRKRYNSVSEALSKRTTPGKVVVYCESRDPRFIPVMSSSDYLLNNHGHYPNACLRVSDHGSRFLQPSLFPEPAASLHSITNVSESHTHNINQTINEVKDSVVEKSAEKPAIDVTSRDKASRDIQNISQTINEELHVKDSTQAKFSDDTSSEKDARAKEGVPLREITQSKAQNVQKATLEARVLENDDESLQRSFEYKGRQSEAKTEQEKAKNKTNSRNQDESEVNVRLDSLVMLSHFNSKFHPDVGIILAPNKSNVDARVEELINLFRRLTANDKLYKRAYQNAVQTTKLYGSERLPFRHRLDRILLQNQALVVYTNFPDIYEVKVDEQQKPNRHPICCDLLREAYLGFRESDIRASLVYGQFVDKFYRELVSPNILSDFHSWIVQTSAEYNNYWVASHWYYESGKVPDPHKAFYLEWKVIRNNSLSSLEKSRSRILFAPHISDVDAVYPPEPSYCENQRVCNSTKFLSLNVMRFEVLPSIWPTIYLDYERPLAPNPFHPGFDCTTVLALFTNKRNKEAFLLSDQISANYMGVQQYARLFRSDRTFVDKKKEAEDDRLEKEHKEHKVKKYNEEEAHRRYEIEVYNMLQKQWQSYQKKFQDANVSKIIDAQF